MSYDYSYPGTLPSKKGWGKGWPNCQTDKVVRLVVPTSHGNVEFRGGVREEAEELFRLVLMAIDAMGYRLKDGGCWGGACRATKDSDGNLTDRPSVHSWYLAIDINAPDNVFGGGHDIPRWVADLLHEYGFRWLGPPIGDWMHFDFCGSPRDLKRKTRKARRELGWVEDDMRFERWHNGWEAHEAGERFRLTWDRDKKAGWRDRETLIRQAVNQAQADPTP